LCALENIFFPYIGFKNKGSMVFWNVIKRPFVCVVASTFEATTANIMFGYVKKHNLILVGLMIIHVLHAILTKQLLAAFRISAFTCTLQFTCTVHANSAIHLHCSREQFFFSMCLIFVYFFLKKLI